MWLLIDFSRNELYRATSKLQVKRLLQWLFVCRLCISALWLECPPLSKLHPKYIFWWSKGGLGTARILELAVEAAEDVEEEVC